MAGVGTVLGVAQTLITALDSAALRQICNIMRCESDLEELKTTVETVRKVLGDAESKADLPHAAEDYIGKLKDAVYDADDLFDEFLTLAERKQQLKVDGEFREKVLNFFSSSNPLKVALTTSRKVKKIRKKLDKIADDHSKFGFVVDNKPIRERRSETCSYVNAPDIIGREEDMETLIAELLDTDSKVDVCSLTIVGVGGLGKTTLAQLVYNDERVMREFPLSLWICISDQDGNQFDVKRVISKILELAIGNKVDGDLSLEEVHKRYREELEGKKYLIVLDDLWNENRNKWIELGQFLKLGASGSRIVVTTRSLETARAIGNGYTYKLQGLSDEHSWNLFKITAFDIGPNQVYPPDFVEIGKKIVEKCANVPLAIKVIGSLLYGQDISKWLSFQQSALAKIRGSEAQIMSILKLSYYNLEPPLKTCFSYCAIFPKDCVVRKELLKLHWSALGYIFPFDEGQSIEDAAEEYFLILLRRCFFQEVNMDKNGEIVSFVIHDLMHDVAQEVAKHEICTAAYTSGDRIRHVYSVLDWPCTESSFPKSKIRSCYEAIRVQPSLVNTLVNNWICLRTLTLKLLDSSNLPDSIGKLVHLRFLDLSNNLHLKMLPNSVTELYNLETLYLKGCCELKELPKQFSKLVKLRHLQIKDCKLTCMPPGMDNLTRLCKLAKFVVVDETSGGMQHVGQLKDLRALVNLRGSIEIQICENVRASAAPRNDWGGSRLEGAEHLKAVCIRFPHRKNTDDAQKVVDDEGLMENLQLHPNLRELEVTHYAGVKLPMWGRSFDNWGSLLSKLVKIKIEWCDQLLQLSLLGKLQYLKSLDLSFLRNLEYVDVTSHSTTSHDTAGSVSGSSSSVTDLPLFPSLESVELRSLEKLRGWWSGVGLADQQPPFPRLTSLLINNCPELSSFPRCPCLETLRLWKSNERLQITTTSDNHSSLPLLSPFDIYCPSVSMQLDPTNANPKLSVLLDNLNSLPVGRVTSIHLAGGINMESLSEVEEVLKNYCSTLRSLKFSECGLKSLSRGLEHLTALESLELVYCLDLNLDEDDDMPWRALHQNLRSLNLHRVGNMEKSLKTLPSGMQHLTSLQNLKICGLDCLESLPEWIGCLSALQSLKIAHCNSLKTLPDSMQNLTFLQMLDIERCPRLFEIFQGPSSVEWRKIQHVPHFSIIDRRPRPPQMKVWKQDR